MVEINAETLLQLHVLILTFAIPLVIAFVRQKLRCIEKIDKRSFRQSQAFLVYAEMIDNQTNITQNNQNSNLRDTIEGLLKDEKGNL